MDKIEIHEKCPECGGPVEWATSGVYAWQHCECGWTGNTYGAWDIVEALTAAERRARIAEEALGSACVRLAPHILAVDARWKSCFDHDPRPTESELTAELVEHFKTLAEAELYPDDAPTADEMARETEGGK
jgi:hypothetical protein